MQKIILSFLIVIVCGMGAFAQTNIKHQNNGLPANLAKLNGEYPDNFLKNPVIKMRLKKLLGQKDFDSLYESFETQTPFEKKGTFLFASGCLIHACTHVESAIAIDLVNKTIHAGIYRDEEKTKFFNENNRKTPNPLKNWADRLASLKE